MYLAVFSTSEFAYFPHGGQENSEYANTDAAAV